jgi:phosphatidylserine decarboxylase
MGSTVVLLFPKDAVAWSDALAADAEVRMGQQIATITHQR